MQKTTLLVDAKPYKSAEDWVNQLLAKGKYAFALHQFRADFPEQSNTANKFALKRLVDNEQIISIHKCYYLIIPPQYRSKGIPPFVFRCVYERIGQALLSGIVKRSSVSWCIIPTATGVFVATRFPVLRPMQKKGLKLNYISKKEIPITLLYTRKTEAGYLKISNPALTATDLIQYAKRVGGINRAATVLAELADSIKPDAFDTNLLFGSVLTSKFSTSSDIDLIVDFKDIDVNDYADNYFDFKFSLQEILNRPVDLLEEHAIKNPYFKQVVNKTIA